MSSVASIDVPMAMGHLDTAAALLESAETKAGTIRSAVMSPDITDTVRDGDITKIMRDDQPFVGDGATVANEAMSQLRDDPQAKQLFAAHLRECISVLVIAELKMSQLRVMNEVEPILDEMTAGGKALRLVNAEVAKHLATAGNTPTSQLRVAGATGVNEVQARTRWEHQREKIRTAWLLQRVAKMRKAKTTRELSDNPGEDPAKKTEWRATVKDQEALVQAQQVDIYEAYCGDGEAVKRNTDTYVSFSVPKHLDDGQYEQFKNSYVAWRNKPSTVKQYPLILYDLDYIDLRCSRCSRGNASETTRHSEAMG